MDISHRPGLWVPWLIVTGVTVIALKVLDRVPGMISGTPPGVRVFVTVEEAERALGTRLWLPAYYPDTLRWPPERIEADRASPTTVAIRILGRRDGRERLVLCQSIGRAPSAPPGVLLPAGRTLERVNVTVVNRAATLVRLLDAGGRVVHDLWWDHDGRRLTVRSAGPLDELLRIAASVERSRP